ncbi:rhomboid family intramembrane serine protease [Nakamurella leprariae]|uniref:Rhomboid family intramembrane serine protease n=1 Tax=Nakamurella leprariae TaxID=2803911 RepID=A0A938Y700_9ACTN|nr:rhomboid family intramembrane serine protease [Nakamurella leprariae]MBM9467191.1 rhomboid family intramembrane serine protease [Nakamurella leprariae]
MSAPLPSGPSFPAVPPSAGATERRRWLPENARVAGITVGAFAVVLVVVQVVNALMSDGLVRYGIEPRSVDGLLGVLTGPFIHASWTHLWSNLIPFVVLGFLVMVGGVKQFISVTVLVWLISGLGVWLIAPAHTDTVGASGVVFGWLAYLVARGIFTRTWQHILLGVLLLAVWGSLFWTGIVQVAVRDLSGVVTVSWQGHLFGAIGGVLAAFLVSSADRANRRRAIPS